MAHKLTSTQPEPAKTRIYGSQPVKPNDAGTRESRQPQVLPHTKIHGVKQTRTIRVRVKASKDKRVLTIPFEEFDPAKHVAVKADT